MLGASVLTGSRLASRLAERVERLRAVRGLIERFSGELAYRRTPTGQLLQAAAGSREFAALPFLRKAAESFDGSVSFSRVWEAAVRQSSCPPEERELLLEMGQIVGVSNRDSQVAALALLASRADGILEEQAKRAAVEGRLCRSMGVLGGLLFLVLAL